MKKAQVTVFVALGILLLILVGIGLFFLSNRNVEFTSNIKEAEEIHELISQCLELNSLEAIKLAGMNGGWVNPEDANLIPNPVATRGNFVVYSPSVLPYWYYVDESNARSLQPPLCSFAPCALESYGSNSVQSQVEQFVETKLERCVNLADYEDRVDIERDEPFVDVEFARENVIVSLEWPHKISQGNEQEEITSFIATVEVPFVELYELSSSIVDAERYGAIFSKQTMSMISLYSGFDEPLPPLSHVSFSLFGGERIWVTHQVKEDFRNQIMPLMQLYQLKGSKNYVPVELEGDDTLFTEGIYSGFDIDFGENEDFSNVNAYVRVPYVNPEFKLNGGSQVIRGEKLTGAPDFIMKLLGLGLTRYRTTYSVAYPLIIELEAPNALNGEGFNFVSAFEVNIFANQPTTAEFIPEPPEIEGAGIGIQLAHRDGTDFELEVINQLTSEGVANIPITYDCGESYFLGLTDRFGKLVVEMPYCTVGGQITVFNPDYSDAFMQYNHDGTEDKLRFTVWPVNDKEASVAAITQTFGDAIDGTLPDGLTTVQRIKDSEFAMLILEPLETSWPPVQILTFGDGSTLMNQLNQQEDFSTTRDSLGEEIDTTINSSLTALTVVPGNYKVTIMIIDQQPIHIPKDSQGGILGFGEEEIPAQTFEAWPSGGAVFEFTFTKNNVYEENEWLFVAEKYELPSSWRNIEARTWNEDKQNGNVVGIEIR